MSLLQSKKGLLFLLVLLILLPIGVIAVLNRTNIFPRATLLPLASVKISPGQIVAQPNGEPIHLSAQAVDTNGANVDNIRYQWGMSSTNSIGTIHQESNEKLATFTPSANIGQGDLWVRAFDTSGHAATGSIPVSVGVLPTSIQCSPLPPECQTSNWQACVANMGIPEGGWCPPPIPTPTSCSGKPDGTACDASNCPVCQPNQPCPLFYCRPQQGICRRNYCVPITPSPVPSPGCRYVYPQCAQPIEGIQAPCDPVLVCTSPACPSPPQCPGPIVVGDPGFGGCPRYYCQTTPTPTVWNCDLLKRNQSNSFQQCFQGGFPRICFDKFTGVYQGCITAERDDCTTYNTNANRNILCNIIPSPTPTTTPTSTPTPTFTPTPTRPPYATTIEFRVKFSGVTGGEADGAGVTARFVRSDVNVVTPPIIFTHVGGGIYKATVGLTGFNLPSGPGYSIILKGEKHVARKFCKQTGQTSPCVGNESMTIPFGTLTPVFDFTGLTLDPGDLPYPDGKQDGKADGSDFDVIKSMLSKPCSSLTALDKKTADLDYSGCIDTGDAFLMRKTLETRYDEN